MLTKRLDPARTYASYLSWKSVGSDTAAFSTSAPKPRLCPHARVWVVGEQKCLCFLGVSP